ncbi:MAG: GNAT family N-acetyltransferase [bacterium]|nr:GNAT family N-acetyltransferase [bacterium]
MVINKENIGFRRATVEDVKVLIEFRMRYLSETFGCGKVSEAGDLRESLLVYFAEAVPAGDFVAWLAEYEGEVIATSGMVVWRIPGGYTSVSGKAGYILNMYTVPEARGLGIASRLFDELIREAKELGVKHVHLHATEDGIEIYRKAGFAETSLPELEIKLE